MLAELYDIASSFFFIAYIPAFIAFIWAMVSFIKEKRFSIIWTIIVSLLIAIGIYILGCVTILIVAALLTFYIVYFVCIILIAVILMGIFGS